MMIADDEVMLVDREPDQRKAHERRRRDVEPLGAIEKVPVLSSDEVRQREKVGAGGFRKMRPQNWGKRG